MYTMVYNVYTLNPLCLQETVPTWRKFLGVWDALCIAARLLMHKTPTPSSSTTAAAVGINAPPSHHPNDQHTSPCLHVPLEHIVSSAHGGWHQKNTKAVCFMMQPWSNLTAMWMHTSQFVWYVGWMHTSQFVWGGWGNNGESMVWLNSRDCSV